MEKRVGVVGKSPLMAAMALLAAQPEPSRLEITARPPVPDFSEWAKAPSRHRYQPTRNRRRTNRERMAKTSRKRNR